jgi:hypothetical protein
MSNQVKSSIYFWIVVAICMIPGIYVAHGFDDAPLSDQLEVLLWSLAPTFVAMILFVCQAKAAAWGWLVAVGVTTYIVLVAVKLSSTPSASLAFFWAPIWNLVLVGPVGLGIGILIKKVRSWG